MPFINFGKDAIKHFIILGVLVFFGVVTINHFWHKPSEKNVVLDSESSKVLVLNPKEMTPVQKAQYLKIVSENVENSCAQLEKDFGIKILLPSIYWLDGREIAYRFTRGCYANPSTAREIAHSLGKVRFAFSGDVLGEPSIGGEYIAFPCEDEWADPKNVLQYLNSPPK